MNASEQFLSWHKCVHGLKKEIEEEQTELSNRSYAKECIRPYATLKKCTKEHADYYDKIEHKY